MGTSLESWLDYYRASVADGARLCPSAEQIRKAEGVSRDDLRDGRLPAGLAGRIRQQAAAQAGRPPGADDRQHLDGPPAVDVLVFPWVFNSREEHGEASRTRLEVFVPVVVLARLDADGVLKPHEHAPWIPRDRLQPVTHDYVTVGELTEADAFATRQPFEARSWSATLEYAGHLVQAVAGCEVEEVGGAEYLLQEAGGVCPAEATGGAAIVSHILRLYDALRAGDGLSVGAKVSALPGLLRYAGQEAGGPPGSPPPGGAVLNGSGRHWATVSAVHPLAPTQRAALHALLATPEGGVLAVQGPPGTGKTTLLKSVVAQLWVEAAIARGSCPIIAACSTNNQAVTNVINAYANEEGDETDIWRRRWLPDLRGLGLYAASENSASATGGKYQMLAADGAFAELERNAAWLPKARAQFLAAARLALAEREEGPADVEAAREALHARLVDCQTKIAALFAGWSEVISRLGKLPPETSAQLEAARRARHLRELADSARQRERVDRERVALVEQCARTWDERLAAEPWWQVILAWWPPVQARRDAGRRLALEPFAKALGEWPEVETPTVTVRLGELRREATTMAAASAKEREAAERDLGEWEAIVGELTRRIAGLLAEASDEQRRRLARNEAELWRADGEGLEALADVVWRERAFRTAVHYWEASYLLERAKLEKGGHRRSEDPAQIWERALRRWAMLAPCLVSTFYMLPKFFRDPAPGRDRPLFGVIDLLIGDESGQVAPEKAVASFALARRAFIVGDTLQIEPVWNVPASVDAANAVKFGVVARDEAHSAWNAPARLAVSASGGNLMALAQQASVVSSRDGAGGLLLREHRRCVPEIVAFCNEVYGGQLLPLRASEPASRRILPPLGYASLPYRAEVKGSGRRNPGEARLIAAWIKQRRPEIERHYGKPLSKLVAVVTPFKAQKGKLQEELSRQLGRDHGMTVGTVHALQGAEIPIVIFSPVYDETHRGPFFFNRNFNPAPHADPRKAFQMLNVAVSRAKDTFLVFGCLDAFHPSRNAPSGVLGRHLFGEYGQEITDLPWEAAANQPPGTRLVRGTDEHDQLLRKAIAAARRRLVISSPFLTTRGLEARGVLAQLAEAVRAGVSVDVFTDGGLARERDSFEQAAASLRAAGVHVWISRPDRGIHAKTLIADEEMLVEGSFNWFSAAATEDRYQRYEASLMLGGPEAGEHIERALASLRERVPRREPGPAAQ